jgi:hypothetical protein
MINASGWKKKKKTSPYALGSSQAAHFALVSSLSTMQTLHFHVPGALVGALSPAADQLKPPVGAAGFEDPDIAAGAVVVPFVAADSGRGSSHAPHLVLTELLLIIQTGHFHESAAFIGAFTPAAPQLKPVDAGFAPKTNANVGSEDESATKAAARSLAWLRRGLRSVVTLNENDGSDVVSRRRAACFGSLGVAFVECGSELGPASGRGLATATAGVGAVRRLGIVVGFGEDSEKGTLGWSGVGAGAGVSDTDLVGGGESASFSVAAKPNRSFDGSFGADDFSGNGALFAALNRLPFTAGVAFLALDWESEESSTLPGIVLVGEVGECMSTSGTSSTVGCGAFFCLLEIGASPPVCSSLPCSSVAVWMPFVRGGEGDLSRALRRGGSGCEVPFVFAAEAFPMFWGGRERLLPYNN